MVFFFLLKLYINMRNYFKIRCPWGFASTGTHVCFHRILYDQLQSSMPIKIVYIYWEKACQYPMFESKIKNTYITKTSIAKNYILKGISVLNTILPYIQWREFPLSIDFFSDLSPDKS